MEDTLYSVDGRVFTSAGGAASMDMMLHGVRTDYGIGVANWVADQMIYTSPRVHSQGQRMSLQSRPEVRNAKLLLAMQIMENNLEDPRVRMKFPASSNYRHVSWNACSRGI